MNDLHTLPPLMLDRPGPFSLGQRCLLRWAATSPTTGGDLFLTLSPHCRVVHYAMTPTQHTRRHNATHHLDIPLVPNTEVTLEVLVELHDAPGDDAWAELQVTHDGRCSSAPKLIIPLEYEERLEIGDPAIYRNGDLPRHYRAVWTIRNSYRTEQRVTLRIPPASRLRYDQMDVTSLVPPCSTHNMSVAFTLDPGAPRIGIPFVIAEYNDRQHTLPPSYHTIEDIRTPSLAITARNLSRPDHPIAPLDLIEIAVDITNAGDSSLDDGHIDIDLAETLALCPDTLRIDNGMPDPPARVTNPSDLEIATHTMLSCRLPDIIDSMRVTFCATVLPGAETATIIATCCGASTSTVLHSFPQVSVRASISHVDRYVAHGLDPYAIITVANTGTATTDATLTLRSHVNSLEIRHDGRHALGELEIPLAALRPGERRRIPISYALTAPLPCETPIDVDCELHANGTDQTERFTLVAITVPEMLATWDITSNSPIARDQERTLQATLANVGNDTLRNASFVIHDALGDATGLTFSHPDGRLLGTEYDIPLPPIAPNNRIVLTIACRLRARIADAISLRATLHATHASWAFTPLRLATLPTHRLSAAPPTVVPGHDPDTYVATLTIRNDGDVAEPFTVQLDRDARDVALVGIPDQRILHAGIEHGLVPVDHLAAGESITIAWTIPHPIAHADLTAPHTCPDTRRLFGTPEHDGAPPASTDPETQFCASILPPSHDNIPNDATHDALDCDTTGDDLDNRSDVSVEDVMRAERPLSLVDTPDNNTPNDTERDELDCHANGDDLDNTSPHAARTIDANQVEDEPAPSNDLVTPIISDTDHTDEPADEHAVIAIPASLVHAAKIARFTAGKGAWRHLLVLAALLPDYPDADTPLIDAYRHLLTTTKARLEGPLVQSLLPTFTADELWHAELSPRSLLDAIAAVVALSRSEDGRSLLHSTLRDAADDSTIDSLDEAVGRANLYLAALLPKSFTDDSTAYRAALLERLHPLAYAGYSTQAQAFAEPDTILDTALDAMLAAHAAPMEVPS